jgi:RNA polymerase sigma factor (sigma-70 family)
MAPTPGPGVSSGMDVALVARAQDGDREAFSTLAAASYSRLHRVAQNILSDLDLADDATQQALVSMWRNLPRLREPSRFEAWSCRILVNACYSEARKAHRWLPALDPERDEDPGSAAALSGVVYRDQLERAFRRLPIDQRAVVVLHHYLDLPLDRVAEVLDIPLGTVHSRLHRAMGALRAALEADARLPDADHVPERAR